MREILFRGKSVYTDKWITGYYIGTGTIVKHGDEQYSVDPETVGQFTGLTDKNGKKIFEGDVVVAELKSGTYQGFSWGKQKVVFWRGAFCLESRTGEKTPLGSYSPAVLFKVIGNIHDNPELLEVEG